MDELFSYIEDFLGREPTYDELECCIGMLSDGYSIDGYFEEILEEEAAK